MNSTIPRLVILGGYSMFILVLMLSNKIRGYLHPKFYLFLWITAFVLLIQFFYILLTTKKHKDSFIAITILILPLIFSFTYSADIQNEILNMKGITGLSQNSYGTNQRSSSSNEIPDNIISGIIGIGVLDNKAKLGKAYDHSVKVEKNLVKNIIINDENYIETVEKIINDPVQYYGNNIEISGTIITTDKLPPNNFILSRTVISCCLADAEIVGMIIQSNKQFKEGEWYDIKGEIDIRMKQGIYYPIINVDKYRQIDKKDSYMYR